MTFGQHLEELRACLFKSIFGLFIGCGVGLAFSAPVVNFLQAPAQSALNNFYTDQTEKKLITSAELDRLREAGYDNEDKLSRLRDAITQGKFTYEIQWMDPAVVSSELGIAKSANAQLGGNQPPGGENQAAAIDGPKNYGLKPMVLFKPLSEDARTQLDAFSVQEPFMIYMKASVLVGAVLASPWIFYQIWSFVAAGLYPHERRYVHLFLPASLGLFLLGAAMAFFFVFKQVLKFLLSFYAMLGFNPQLRIDDWMSFVLLMPLAFGISFQLPLVMLFLERIGIFTVQAYLSSWRISVLAIFIIAMLVTPSGDPQTLLLLALPLTGLYFLGVFICWMWPKPAASFD